MTTVRQQAFANAILSGVKPVAAYRLHYDCSQSTDKTIAENASRLANSPKIKALVLADSAEKTESWAWTYSKVMDEIAENLRLARMYKQLGPARACVRDAAELSGLWKEKKSESDVPIIKQTIILQARPASPELPATSPGGQAIDAEYTVLEPSDPPDTVDSPDC